MRILLIGYGTMNKIVARLASEAGHEIAGVISSGETDYPAFNSIDEANADVAIDFSNPGRILPLIEHNFKTPLVVATTGQKEEIVATLKERAAQAPVFFSANMSYGVHVLNNLLKEALNQLADYDLEFVERHHNKKVDAPSGTLVKLLDTALESRGGSYPSTTGHLSAIRVRVTKSVSAPYAAARLSASTKQFLPDSMKSLN